MVFIRSERSDRFKGSVASSDILTHRKCRRLKKKKKKKKKRSKVLRCDNINKKGPGLPKLTMKPSLILSMILNFMQNFKNFAKVKFRDILLTGTGHRDRRLNRDCPGQTGTYGRSNFRCSGFR